MLHRIYMSYNSIKHVITRQIFIIATCDYNHARGYDFSIVCGLSSDHHP